LKHFSDDPVFGCFSNMITGASGRVAPEEG
jgi:hypothetical protein